MKNYSTYVYGKEFNKGLLDTSKELKNFVSENRQILLQDFYIGESQGLHAISKALQMISAENKVYGKILSRTIMQSESLSGGSSSFGLLFFSYFIEEILKNKEIVLNVNEFKQTLVATLSAYKKFIEDNMKPANEEKIKHYVEKSVQDSLLSNVIFEAITLSGIEGKIYIESSKNSMYVVEKTVGYEFFLKPVSIFLPKASSSMPLEFSDCKVLLIDGIIEKVSEVDQILRFFFNTKESLVVVARGFSEEVLATLKANYDRELLKIVPVLLESDLESLNLLSDLSCVCGSNVVSAMKGDLLSLIKPEELSSVEKIRLLSNKIIVENTTTTPQVFLHIETLLKKRYDNQMVEDIVSLFDKRIKSLSQNTTTIRLPNLTTLEEQTKKAKIDVTLRDIKSIINHGIVNCSTLAEAKKSVFENSGLPKIFLDSLLKTFKAFGNKDLPSLSAFVGVYVFAKTAETILSSTGLVVSQED